MTLSWCSVLLQVLFLAGLANTMAQVDPEDIKMTIKSRNGEVVDCVDIYEQPSLNNPLLKDLKHQIMSDIARTVAKQRDEETQAAAVEQEWHKITRQCPTGSIPILRTDDAAPDLGPLYPVLDDSVGDANSPRYELATAIAANGPYSGAYVLLPAWNTSRKGGIEYTATYLLLAGTPNPDFDPKPGILPPDVTNQIGVGLFGYPFPPGVDNNPLLNIFYTPDDGKTLCYNLNCGGFVQTNSAVALGASVVKAASSVNDTAPSYLVSIHKDPAGPWHVLVNDADLGYYPRTIFPWLFPEVVANTVGGTVLNTWPDGKHTDTIMGNGRRPPGDDKPAVAKGYVAVDLAGNPFPDTLDNTVHTVPNCYDLKILGQSKETPGSSVAFGGSGGPDCAPQLA
ncbi:hypothetical protein VPH35_011061 [Triticum aestivum]